MMSDLPPSWKRASETQDSLAFAQAVCSTAHWPVMRDGAGRNVWMFSLAQQQGAAWPHIASRPGAWEAFAVCDRQGRTVLDYLMAFGFSAPPRLSSWVEEVGERLGQMPHKGPLCRLATSPLPWPAVPCLPPLFSEHWAPAIAVEAWDLDPFASSPVTAALLGYDLQGKSRLWPWIEAAVHRQWNRLDKKRRWWWAMVAALNGFPLPQEWEGRALELAEVREADRQPLLPPARRWLSQAPSPRLAALVMALTWEEGKQNGRRSARL